GEVFIKLSLIFNRTIKPASINMHSPEEASSNSTGNTYNPKNKHVAPNS
ncbi:MAG: hypothetical protein ACJA1B_002741, partial [Polaribacter sp.]